MTIPKLKKGWLIVIAVILLFAFTNPSLKDCKEFLGYKSYGYFSRSSNFLVCSIYKTEDKRYLGILMNFIEITKTRIQTASQMESLDSTQVTSHISTSKINSPKIYKYGSKYYTEVQIEKAAKDNGVSFDTYVNDIGFKVYTLN